ncbi:solute carrier family 49 member 4-like isoform X2 [Tubulanus polymorphus]|uniref:solute carrier family 49 member 4-like isoform X2 n=1 Tax=Tubulanus polymorphus TaxID=672921 RepID=UPI003DA438B7
MSFSTGVDIQPDYNGYSLIFTEDSVRTSRERWYILLVFSLSAIMQGNVWNTWAPIAKTADIVFEFKSWDIALLSNWPCIMAVIATVPFSWLLEVKGLRISMLLANFLIMAGTGIRCISSDPKIATCLIHVCGVLNGLAGPAVMIGPTVLSSTWFPPDERTTATAISSVVLYVGLGLGFLLGPLIVGLDKRSSERIDGLVNISSGSQKEVFASIYEDQKYGIMNLMYVTFSLSCVIFMMTLFHFPSKPSHPPSVSASKERESFTQGVKDILTNYNMWLVVLPFAFTNAVNLAWGNVLELTLEPFAISQIEAGWLGFGAIQAGCVFGIIAGLVSDRFLGHMKIMIITVYGAASIFFTHYALMASSVVEPSVVLLFISVIMGTALQNGCIPLFLDMTCETVYPVAESVATGLLVLLVNFLASIILFLLWIPSIGVHWLTWSIPVSLILAICIMIFYKDSYNRLQLDVSSNKLQ